MQQNIVDKITLGDKIKTSSRTMAICNRFDGYFASRRAVRDKHVFIFHNFSKFHVNLTILYHSNQLHLLI